MVESVSATQSIQETNAAYLAQVNAPKTANEAPQEVGASGFAQELQSIQKYELPPPTPLTPTAKTASASSAKTAPASVSNINTAQKGASETDTDSACPEPKIARSDRMACAEKATEMSYSDDEFSVADLVDFLNPLQHIPVLGTLYREATGDTIKPEVQIAGSIVMGAITGSIFVSAIAGVASAVIEQSSGKEPLVQVADALWGDTINTGDTLTEDNVVATGEGVSVAQYSAANPKVADASQAASEAIKVAQATENTEIAAPVTAPIIAASAAMPTQKAKVNSTLAVNTVSTGASRVGNVIYTSPYMKSAAKVNRTASATQVSASSSADTQKTAKTNLDNTTLGTLIHEQAKAREAGQQLPPELVQDMMLMAMDKYKAAHVASAQSAGMTAMP